MATRKTYSPEFKIEAVRLAKERGFAQTGRDLGVNPNQIHNWRARLEQDVEQKSILKRLIRRIRAASVQHWELFVSVLTLIITVVAVIIAYVALSNQISKVGNQVDSVERKILSTQFNIKIPNDTTRVGPEEVISGVTPFLGMNHYIVVTSLRTGIESVEGDARVSLGGVWGGTARFGTGRTGEGEQFIIRALATGSTLPNGPLTEVPADAVFSEAVTVVRKQNER